MNDKNVKTDSRAEYLRIIEQQIRCKKAYPEIKRELEDHMNDQKQAYLEQGMTQEDAENRAVKEMGDPVLTGEALDQVHRPKTDWSLIVMVIALSLFGIWMQCLIFPHMENERIATTYQSRTILYHFIGMAVMVLLFFFDYRLLGKYVWQFYGGYMLLSFLFMMAGTYGLPWFIHGGYATAFQAGNFCLILFVPVFAAFVYHFRDQGWKGFLKSFLMLVVTYLFFWQMGCCSTTVGMVSAGVCVVLLVKSSVKGIYGRNRRWMVGISTVLLLGVPAGLVFVVTCTNLGQRVFAAYQIDRLRVIFHPEQYAQGAGFTVMQAKNIASSATLTGSGELGFFQDMSGAYSDYIISCALSYFGILAVVILAVFFLAFLGRIFHISINQKNILGQLLCTAVFCTFLFKAILYFAANLGAFPLTAVDMPFLSFGLNNTVSNYMLIGLVLSVHRYTNVFGRSLTIKTI